MNVRRSLLRHLTRIALLGATIGQAASAAAAPATPPSPDAAPALTAPILERGAEATWPAEALSQRIEGAVVLRLAIDAEGMVTSAEVVEAAGHGFDDAAVDAAKRFVFRPARRGDTPIASRITYTYTFTLAKEPAGEPAPPPPTTGALHGQVLLHGSESPLASARVTLRGPNGVTHEVRTDEGGAWSADDLAPGVWHVTVAAEGFAPIDADETVAIGESVGLVYRASPEVSSGEVQIRGARPDREVTKRTITRQELAKTPGTNGDALRAIQNLPGVARSPGGMGMLIVRGSSPSGTQVFIDGAYAPLVYHFGGLSSVVPTEMIESLDFYPGNFSARYGRVTGGVVDVRMREVNPDGKLHGLAQVDMVDARVMAEGPVPLLRGWSFAIAGRRSWVDAWLKPVLEKTDTGVRTAPVYYDGQAFLETKPTSRSRLRIGAYGSSDALSLVLTSPSSSDAALGGSVGISTSFWRLQANYESQLTDDVSISAMGSWGRISESNHVGSMSIVDRMTTLVTRGELAWRAAAPLTLRTGWDVAAAPFEVDVVSPPAPQPGEADAGPIAGRRKLVLSTSGNFVRPAAWAEADIVPTRRLKIVPGLRVDYASEHKRTNVSPRLNARFDVAEGYPRTTAKAGVGVFWEPPTAQESVPVFGTPGLQSNRSIHYSAGVEQELSRQIEVSVEGFYKQLDELVSRAPTTDGGVAYDNAGTGKVVGAEMMLRYKPDDRFFGWVSYTLSRSTRTDRPGQPERLFEYDQTHVLTALGSYQLGRGWQVGARLRVTSGNPYTPCTGGLFSAAAGSYACVSGAPYGSRLPAFHQLDVRVDKTWKFSAWSLTAYLDVINAYNRKNPEGINYNFDYTQTTYNSGLPIIPSIGLRGEL